MITAEWQHGHGIASNFSEGSGGSRGHLRAHRGANVNTCAPVERLVNQRHGGGASAAEDNRVDQYALRVLPGRIDGRALRCGSSEPRIGMSGLRSSLLGTATMAALLFIPAGTFDYWQAWNFMAVFVVATTAITVYGPSTTQKLQS